MSPLALAALDAWASRAPVLDPLGYEPAVDDRTAAEIEADADAMLADDGEFDSVCDARRERAIEAMEAGAL